MGVGATVTWTWAGNAIHDVTGSFGSSGLQTSGSFSVTFSTPGTFSYVCSIHQSVGMTGSIVVE
ncbi:MAG: plastocyanin/azurin family copper-binding protein [Dehalococcoidia bacterium]